VTGAVAQAAGLLDPAGLPLVLPARRGRLRSLPADRRDMGGADT
jgi:hypothetical protein